MGGYCDHESSISEVHGRLRPGAACGDLPCPCLGRSGGRSPCCRRRGRQRRCRRLERAAGRDRRFRRAHQRDAAEGVAFGHRGYRRHAQQGQHHRDHRPQRQRARPGRRQERRRRAPDLDPRHRLGNAGEPEHPAGRLVPRRRGLHLQLDRGQRRLHRRRASRSAARAAGHDVRPGIHRRHHQRGVQAARSGRDVRVRELRLWQLQPDQGRRRAERAHRRDAGGARCGAALPPRRLRQGDQRRGRPGLRTG